MSRSLAVVVVTFNARADVRACLESLHAHPPARPWTLVVVDNASDDGTPDTVATEWPEARLIRLEANVGFGAANNLGVAATASDLVLLLNSDTVVPHGQIEALCRPLDQQRGLGAAGPRLEDEYGHPELSWGAMMSPWHEARQKALGWMLDRGPRWMTRQVARRLDRPRLVDWVSGACLLIRRTAWDEAGGFDPRFFMYAEDVDLCAALRRLGYGVRFSPEARIVHRRGRSRAAAPARTTDHYRRSQLAFYEKHHPHWAPLLRWYLRLKGAMPS
jgi:GT2 family glycosyltransferase